MTIQTIDEREVVDTEEFEHRSDYLTRREAAALCRVPLSTFDSLRRQNRFPFPDAHMASTCSGVPPPSRRSSRPEALAMADNGGRIDPKTRRSLPEGIRFRKDRGKYQVRVWAIGLNGESRERSFNVDTLAEAKKLRAETVARSFPDGDMTLTQWHARHWPVIESSIRASTARAYDCGWRLRVKPWLGHARLEKLTAGDIEQAMSEWEGSASTRVDALSVLSRLLDGAVRTRIVPMNQARLARRPRLDSGLGPRSRALTAAEVPVLLGAIEMRTTGAISPGWSTPACAPMRRQHCASRMSISRIAPSTFAVHTASDRMGAGWS